MILTVLVMSLKPAKRKRIHTFISTSELHMKYKLKMQKEEVIDAIKKVLKELRNLPMILNGHLRMHLEPILDFLYKTIEIAINSGATTINIPDTVGYAIPENLVN